jgi:phenylalanine-4-hydroxylase
MTRHETISLPQSLRGDYSSTREDFTTVQDHAAIPEADHATWRTLYARQSALLPRHAARAYRESLARLDVAGGVPDFAAASAQLSARTGFSLVAVPGLIPDGAFFEHLAARRFPVTVWIRRPEELDYIVEPDVFHDFFGHVPLLGEPVFADFLEAYGRLGEHAARIGALKPLARLYWFMVEFGLIREEGGIRAYGAGILSSSAETVYSTTSGLRSPEDGAGAAGEHRRRESQAETPPRRLRFDITRVLRSDYDIDRIQPTYFVIEDYVELFACLARVPALLEAARDAQPIPPGAADPADVNA